MAVTEKTPPLTDERLVELALDGDEEAFGLLVRRYQRRLTAFLSQLVGDLELARELSQEAFVRAWSALSRFDPKYRFSSCRTRKRTPWAILKTTRSLRSCGR